MDHSSDSDAPRSKSPALEEFRCKLCKFTTNNRNSLQRHQTTHSADTDSGAESERMSVSPACQDEMFCKECKIQFSSYSTYRGHKEFYCRFRLAGQDKTCDSEMASPGSHAQTMNELTLKMLKSPTASLKSQLLVAKGLHPALLAATNPLLQSPLFLQELLAKSHQEEITKALAKAQQSPVATVTKPASTEDQPLDLSKSSRKDSDSNRTSSPEKSEPSIKSEPSSPGEHLSPVSKKMRLSEDMPDVPLSGSKTPLNIPTLHPTLLLGSQTVQYVNKKPIPPLQSVSRCVECNIVFYKHENYLIHKEHYCSGRRSNKENTSDSDNQDGESTGKQDVAAAKDSGSEPESKLKEVHVESKVSVTHEPRKDLCYKYFCIPCKIKFSSAGTLKAHKEFYCPHGKDNSEKSEAEENSGQGANSTYHCDNCNNDFTSARLLKLHICMGEVSPAPLLRCLYCDYVTQTENRLSEHMKVHVPTKAFKCNLCGYRGNTARGMRMHGKVHIENGEDFTDENMIEFEEPPLVPIQRNGLNDNKGPVDVETELIRMKNEPYKRRRSRKSFEKSENMVSFLSQNLMTQICAACGQTFSNVSDFVIHLRMHEIAALEAMKSLKSLRCEHCNEYVAESLTGLLVHMQTKHPEQLPGSSRHDSDALSDDERSRSQDILDQGERSRPCSVDSTKTNTSVSSQENRLLNIPKVHGHRSSVDGMTPGYIEVKVEKESSDSESESRSGAVNGSRHNPEEKDLRKTNPHSPPVQSMEETRSQNGSEQSSSEDSHSEARHRKSPYRELSPQVRRRPSCLLPPHTRASLPPQTVTARGPNCLLNSPHQTQRPDT